MPHYKGALDPADEACVFYSHHAMEIKKMPPLPEEIVRQGFGNGNVKVFTDRHKLENWLFEKDYSDASLLLMSSGNYEGLDMTKLSDRVMGS